MIRNQMKPYKYYKYGGLDEYGIPSASLKPIGEVKLSLHLLNQNISDNALYKDASFIGLTFNDDIDENWIIEEGNTKLKVLYVNHTKRFNQVFLQVI